MLMFDKQTNRHRGKNQLFSLFLFLLCLRKFEFPFNRLLLLLFFLFSLYFGERGKVQFSPLLLFYFYFHYLLIGNCSVGNSCIGATVLHHSVQSEESAFLVRIKVEENFLSNELKPSGVHACVSEEPVVHIETERTFASSTGSI